MKCWTCNYAESIPGDCHISCSNPPMARLEIGSGTNERYAIAEKQAIDKKAVVRCLWPGSGYYPLAFDGNTVFGCCNFIAKKQKELNK